MTRDAGAGKSFGWRRAGVSCMLPAMRFSRQVQYALCGIFDLAYNGAAFGEKVGLDAALRCQCIRGGTSHERCRNCTWRLFGLIDGLIPHSTVFRDDQNARRLALQNKGIIRSDPAFSLDHQQLPSQCSIGHLRSLSLHRRKRDGVFPGKCTEVCTDANGSARNADFVADIAPPVA